MVTALDKFLIKIINKKIFQQTCHLVSDAFL